MSKGTINKVILIGNLGNEPDVRYMNNGEAVANVSLATSEAWRDKNSGEQQERTEWHRVVFFGKVAEVVKQYLHKGSKIYVEGQLRTRKWQDKDGQDRYTTEVVVSGMGGSTMQMLDSRGAGGSSVPYEDVQPRGPAPAASGGGRPPAPPPAPMDQGGGMPFDDDIPF